MENENPEIRVRIPRRLLDDLKIASIKRGVKFQEAVREALRNWTRDGKEKR